MVRATPLRGGQVPSTTRGVVLALVIGVHERARVRDALSGCHDVVFVERNRQLEAMLCNIERPIRGLVIESHDADARSTCDVIRAVRKNHSRIPVIGYCQAGIAHSSDIRALAVAGVHELLFHGIDDSCAALRAVLGSATQTNVGELVAAELLPLVPEKLWPFVRQVTSHPVESQRVTHVALALGHHRKTLVNHCAQAHLPPPQELLAWCRLAVIGYLLGTTSQTVDSIAMQLDFPSDTALRNLVKRYLGRPATEVRECGGLRLVVDTFSRAIARGRPPSLSYFDESSEGMIAS
ncbi:MAG: helix-turn-helix domain-containing protein [bacterium]